MPNINEFFGKPEKVFKAEAEKMVGSKPCSQCDKDVEEFFWDALSMTMFWECPNGHKNSYVVG